ncbi:unnamed protein product [Closterium sp. Naga37s-1]|nr:unnamed protein product [Closterium sp. Naga37s-1]
MYAAPELRATKAHIRGDGRSREDGGDSQGKGIMGGSVGGEAKAGGNVSKSDVTKLKEMGSVSSLSDALASLIAEVGGSADAPATSLDPWLSLLLERLCLRGSFFKSLFAGLSRECGAGGKEEEREEEGEKGGAASLSLKQLDEGRFRDVVAVIANAGHERKAYQDAVRGYTAPSIPVSAAASGAIAAAPGGAVGGGGGGGAAAAAAAAADDNSATATDATKDSSSNPHPTGNPTPAITPSSNIMSSGLFLVLQQCVTGDSTQGDDLLREWGLWAVRNLLEANPENAADVAALEVRGGAQTEGLREMGLAVEVDERSGRPKLRNIGADER